MKARLFLASFLLLVNVSYISAQSVKNIIVIPINFSSNTKSYKVGNLPSQMDLVNQFYKRNSYNQLSINYTVIPQITINHTTSICDYNSFIPEVDNIVNQSGYNIDSYDFPIYTWPSLSCGWAGITTYILITSSGNQYKTRIFINADYSSKILSHEIGHVLGIYHIGGYRCSVGKNGTAQCQVSSSADPYDIMGSGLGDFNIISRNRLNWVESSLVCSDGVYQLDDINSPIGNRGLRIQVDNNQRKGFLFIESRSGFSGLIFHFGTFPFLANDYILDTTPLTGSWLDSNLIEGRSFTYSNLVRLDSVAGKNVNITFLTQPLGCSLNIN